MTATSTTASAPRASEAIGDVAHHASLILARAQELADQLRAEAERAHADALAVAAQRRTEADHLQARAKALHDDAASAHAQAQA
ncbi:MAG: hypothetical protein WAW82_00650, partial [Candidatus Lutibacillus vidarii]